jgi:hypothetical protein
LKALDLNKLRGDPLRGCTHELDAWHDQDAKRWLVITREKVFVLDRLDRAFH